ncbi:DUF1559 domain-containing protein [bacterium]|nr:MAG: DUF1559 domain-containing protein [bacterium]
MHYITRSRSAFTLIELLVVIAIIAILAAILFPVFAAARQKARDTSCLSNMKQIGLSVQQYVQDYDSIYPIYYAYNSNPSAGTVGHKGVEVLLQPYAKSTQLFKCPNDLGGPTPETSATYGCPSEPTKRNSYADCYGSSYKFSKATFSVVANESSENNALLTTAALVNDAEFAKPAETRLMRDEMFPWFSPQRDPGGVRYGYGTDYYRQWHPTGGAMLYADGHAKYLASDMQYDLTWKDAAATKH